jgi:ATP-binding cassette, subfamily B, multidrug efflux pump
MILGFLALLLSNSTLLLAPHILKDAIDSLRESVIETDMSIYALAFLGVMIIQGVFKYFVRQTLGVVSRRIEYDMRNDIFRHIQQMSLSLFHRTSTGDLMSRATNDLQSVRMLLGPGIMYSANAIVIFIAVTIKLLTMEITLTCIALIPMIILPFTTNRLSKKLYDRSKAVQEQIANISGRAQEAISGVRVVKAYGREASLFEQFKDASKQYVDRSMALVKIQGTIWPLMGAIGGMSSVITIWYGGILVIENTISLGELVAFETYLGFLMWPLMSFGWVINIIQRGSASMTRINEMMQKETPEHTDISTPEVIDVKGEIEVKHLSFSYDHKNIVLDDISFKIQQGQTLAIIGSTGAGKSTLVNLIGRLYDPPPNTLFVDGVDVMNMPQQQLRDALGFIPQDTLLFSKTIGENIAYGKPEASLEEIKHAAEMAQILKDIQGFPDQFETIVGERGVTLSGGQKQRTAIARAILTDPRILILDDALASVDTYTEEEILKHLIRIMKERTTIIIAHRISTIKNADLILVLDDGKIIEQGQHDALIKRQGVYARLFEKQLLQDALKVKE